MESQTVNTRTRLLTADREKAVALLLQLKYSLSLHSSSNVVVTNSVTLIPPTKVTFK